MRLTEEARGGAEKLPAQLIHQVVDALLTAPPH